MEQKQGKISNTVTTLTEEKGSEAVHVQSPVHVENGTDGRRGERDQMRGRKTMKTNVRSHRLRRIDESGRTATIVSHELSGTSYHHIIGEASEVPRRAVPATTCVFVVRSIVVL